MRTLFQKGHKGYWKGKKRVFSDITKKKMSDSKKGKVFTASHKEKIISSLKKVKHTQEWNQRVGLANKGKRMPEWRREQISGSNSRWWKGGVCPINLKIRSSLEYRLWRKSVYERDEYCCQECGNVGGKLNAHHIKSFSEHPELRFVLENGITLCEGCHRLTDNFGRPKTNI